jgi:hypothetical protein
MLKRLSNPWAMSLFIFLFSLFFLFWVYSHGGYSDSIEYAKMILNINTGQASYNGYFLFYLITNVFSGFSLSTETIYQASLVLIALSKAAFWAVAFQFLHRYSGLPKAISMIVVCLIMIYSAIPDPYSFLKLHFLYVGKIVPNVWHNGTVIFNLPISVLLFIQQLKIIEGKSDYSVKTVLVILLLAILTAISKPSFMLVYIPTTALFFLINHGISKKFFQSIIPLFFAGLVLVLQYYLIFELNIGLMDDEKRGIGLSLPFENYYNWYPVWFLPFALLFSLGFPLAFHFLYAKNHFSWKKDKDYYYSILLFVIGFLYAGFLVEEGSQRMSGNFAWQMVILYNIHLLVIAKKWIPTLNSNWKTWTNSNKVLVSLFALHIIGGLVYLAKYFLTYSYM